MQMGWNKYAPKAWGLSRNKQTQNTDKQAQNGDRPRQNSHMKWQNGDKHGLNEEKNVHKMGQNKTFQTF